MPEQAHYDQVAEELRHQKFIDGLWTRAFAEASGDTERARALYIQLRVAQLAAGSRYTSAAPPCIPAQSVNQVRPWVRFWARFIDLYLFSLCSGFVFGIVAPGILSGNEMLLSMLVAFLWCFFEPMFLSTWGATPGKALLRVSIRNPDGTLLVYSAALGRSFDVWFRGLGIYYPLAIPLTLLFGYNTLAKHGITSWDKSANTRVPHEYIGPVRVVVATVLILSFSFLYYLGYKNA